METHVAVPTIVIAIAAADAAFGKPCHNQNPYPVDSGYWPRQPALHRTDPPGRWRWTGFGRIESKLQTMPLRTRN